MVELSGADGSVQTFEVHVRLSLCRLFGGNLGPDTGASQAAAGRVAASSRSGANGRALSKPAPLPAMQRATAAEGPAPSATALAVRRCDGSGAPLRPVPMQRGPAPDPLAGR